MCFFFKNYINKILKIGSYSIWIVGELSLKISWLLTQEYMHIVKRF